MARRKKKSKSSLQGSAPRIEPQLKVKKSVARDDSQFQAMQPPPQEIKKPKTKKNASGVGIGTCLAGMFLTLILGVYVGTLLPDVMRTHSIALKSVPESSDPTPSASSALPTDQELRHLVAELEKKAEANPESAPDWINLGNIYFDSQQPEKAIGAYEKALSLAPQNADVLTDLGIMYREIGKFDKAIECFRRAVSINPRHENAMYNEGVVLLNDLHKKSEAADAWQRLLEINPQAHSPQGKPLKDLIGELH